MLLRKLSLGLSVLGTVGAMSGSPSFAGQNDRLDLAGRERMLIQRIVKSSCYVLSDGRSTAIAERVVKDTGMFEETLRSLIDGSDALGWAPEENDRVLAALNGAYSKWDSLRPAALQVAHGDMASVAVMQIVTQTDDAVAAMNNAVTELQKANAVAGVDPRVSLTLNLAGRQRMLSQKVAKEFCFVYNDVSTEAMRASLTKSMSLFEETLSGLQNATYEGDGFVPPPADGAILLHQVNGTWSRLQPFLAAAANGESVTHDDLEEVMSLTDTLLSQTAATVKAYVAANG